MEVNEASFVQAIRHVLNSCYRILDVLDCGLGDYVVEAFALERFFRKIPQNVSILQVCCENLRGLWIGLSKYFLHVLP